MQATPLMSRTKKTFSIFDRNPADSQAIKPSELIQIREHDQLTLYARRAITLLWHNAHQQGIAKGKVYIIPLTKLLSANHHGYEELERAIESLMKTLVIIPLPGGGTRRAQVLSDNDMDGPDRKSGTLSYRLSDGLIEILAESRIWGRISIPELMLLSSKYSIPIYEHVSQWIGLQHKTSELFTLEEIRILLGVESANYERFGDLNKWVLKVVQLEINALAPFNITFVPIKTGRSVTHIRLFWHEKSIEERKEAYREAHRPRVGRRARIQNQGTERPQELPDGFPGLFENLGITSEEEP